RSAAELLHAAAANFAVASDSLGHPEWTGVLMLAEMKEAAWFEDTRETGGWEGGGWTVVPDAEDDLLLRARGDGRELRIVAGRQLASREGIELLTLATRARLPDQLPLEEALQRAEATGGLTVLPWGAGKWLGRRGNWMREALQRQRPAVWAGD